MNSNNCIAFSHSFVNVFLSNSNLLLILSLVLAKLGALEVGLDSIPELPPEPDLANIIVPDGSLATVEG